MTRQEAFDRAARHLLAQGKPSGRLVNGNFRCLYSGSGCALRPFLTEEQAAEFDRDYGGVKSIPAALLPDYIAEDLSFYSALQSAHDDPAQDVYDAPVWLPIWRDRMIQLAEHYKLSTEALASDAGGSGQ